MDRAFITNLNLLKKIMQFFHENLCRIFAKRIEKKLIWG